MRKITMIIEKSPDLYCAYSEEEDVPLNGCGNTIEECKQEVLNCIETVKEFDERNRPKFLDDDYEIVYEFDQSVTEELIKEEIERNGQPKRLMPDFFKDEDKLKGEK